MTFILVTLTYFQLLEAVKLSDFLNTSPDLPSVNTLLTAQTSTAVIRRPGTNHWVGYSEGTQPDLNVNLRQIIISLDSSPNLIPKNFETDLESEGLLDEKILDQLKTFEEYLRTELSVESEEGTALRWDPDLCYRPPQNTSVPNECFATSLLSPLPQTSIINRSLFPSERTYVITLAFTSQSTSDQTDWLAKLIDAKQLSQLSSLSNVQYTSVQTHQPSERSPNGLGLHFALSPPDPTGLGGPPLRDMRDARWVVVAFKAFILRFWGLAKVSV